jgi:hypothetical protein
MFDELLKLVTNESQQPIVNNPQVLNQHNETAIHITTTSIFESLKSEVKQGNGFRCFESIRRQLGRGGKSDNR